MTRSGRPACRRRETDGRWRSETDGRGRRRALRSCWRDARVSGESPGVARKSPGVTESPGVSGEPAGVSTAPVTRSSRSSRSAAPEQQLWSSDYPPTPDHRTDYTDMHLRYLHGLKRYMQVHRVPQAKRSPHCCYQAGFVSPTQLAKSLQMGHHLSTRIFNAH